ncbi:hypothetical protein GUB10_06400 [Salegentibacter sp. BLCTC]|uniref:polysaccharide lyase n=1 Tax=Salegentibacter sp. BLCTC TaxID=2697368 RepID=UPI00187B6794|nr:polysaccharide lyase [Salegentibacter sp. BLCTC]MBE7639957.1 hypothetical protein [Salegentibacter sp. BLCTC]
MKYICYLLLFSAFIFLQGCQFSIGKKQTLSFFPPLPIDQISSNLILEESFENIALETNPQAGNFYLEYAKNHSFQLEKDIVRKGATAGRFEIRKNDPQIWGGHRSEMSQAQSTTKKEGWYGFSQFFPTSYTTDATGEIIAQWHVQADEGEATNRSPSNALIASEGKLKWMLRWDTDRIMENGHSDGLIYIDLGTIPKDKWVDWVVHIKYSHTNTGVLEVWKDGKKVIDRQNMPNTYNDEKYPYFKFGIYKWEWTPTSSQKVIYYDEVRIGNENSSYDEVKPGAN